MSVSISSGASGVEFFSYAELARRAELVGKARPYTATEVGRLSLGHVVDEAYYLKNNTDVMTAVVGGVYGSAFEHFAEVGVREGRAPGIALYQEY